MVAFNRHYGNNNIKDQQLDKLAEQQNTNEVFADHFIRPEIITTNDVNNNEEINKAFGQRYNKNYKLDNTIYYDRDDDEANNNLYLSDENNSNNKFYKIQDFDDDNNFYNRWDQQQSAAAADDQCLMRIKDLLNELGITI